LGNIYQSWFNFKRGKNKTKELEFFTYNLEENLWRLYLDLNNGQYAPGSYRHFIIADGKRRDIAVVGIRDRVVHRLVYDYLVKIYDHIFIYDVWSCRKNKGLTGAIERTQFFFKKYPRAFVWRADITKFFDNVKQDELFKIICRHVINPPVQRVIKKIIGGYSAGGAGTRERGNGPRGIPIGNLTSQIFANIYLNELDRLVKHILKPQFYLRYGDDFIMIAQNRKILEKMHDLTILFLKDSLGLVINHKNDIILPVRRGAYFLGVEIYPTGRRLKKRIWQQAQARLNERNISSYSGLIKQNFTKKIPYFNWLITKYYNQNE